MDEDNADTLNLWFILMFLNNVSAKPKYVSISITPTLSCTCSIYFYITPCPVKNKKIKMPRTRVRYPGASACRKTFWALMDDRVNVRVASAILTFSYIALQITAVGLQLQY